MSLSLKTRGFVKGGRHEGSKGRAGLRFGGLGSFVSSGLIDLLFVSMIVQATSCACHRTGDLWHLESYFCHPGQEP